MPFVVVTVSPDGIRATARGVEARSQGYRLKKDAQRGGRGRDRRYASQVEAKPLNFLPLSKIKLAREIARRTPTRIVESSG